MFHKNVARLKFKTKKNLKSRENLQKRTDRGGNTLFLLMDELGRFYLRDNTDCSASHLTCSSQSEQEKESGV